VIDIQSTDLEQTTSGSWGSRQFEMLFDLRKPPLSTVDYISLEASNLRLYGSRSGLPSPENYTQLVISTPNLVHLLPISLWPPCPRRLSIGSAVPIFWFLHRCRHDPQKPGKEIDVFECCETLSSDLLILGAVVYTTARSSKRWRGRGAGGRGVSRTSLDRGPSLGR
jgi:hypothetical protein